MCEKQEETKRTKEKNQRKRGWTSGFYFPDCFILMRLVAVLLPIFFLFCLFVYQQATHHTSSHKMPKLYYTPTSCGAATFITAFLGNVKFEAEQVDLKTHQTTSGIYIYISVYWSYDIHILKTQTNTKNKGIKGYEGNLHHWAGWPQDPPNCVWRTFLLFWLLLLLFFNDIL